MDDKANAIEKPFQPRQFLHGRMASGLLIVLCVVAGVLGCLSLAVHYHRIGVITLVWEKAPVSDIRHENGFAYIAPTGRPELSADQHPSAARMFENGKMLPGPANAQHNDIRQIGRGRYSFWYDYLYFSTSDNSNPLTNGRTYEIRYPQPIDNSSAYLLYFTTILALILGAGLFLPWMNERMLGRWKPAIRVFWSWIRGNKLAVASIFLFALSLGLIGLFLVTNGRILSTFRLISPSDAALAGLVLIALAIAGLVRTEEGWTQQLSRNRSLSAGLVILSIAVSVFLLVIFILPASLSVQSRQLAFVAAIGTLTLSILMVRRDGRIGERFSSVWQAPFTALRRAPDLGKAIDGCSSALRYVSSSTHWSGYLLRAATFTLPFLAYAAILASDLPSRIGLEARTGTGIAFLLFFAALLYPVFRHSGWWEDLGSLAITLMFFALPLSGLWNSGYSNGSAIGGLLPWSDASGYYADANHLLEGGMMSTFSERRPLFPGTLSAVLDLVHGNLAVALAVFGAVAILACFLLAREVRRSHGTMAGLVVLAVLFLYYRTYIGITLTENLGIALGAIALAVLWRGAGSSKKEMVWVGIFLLTMAMNARAGAFLILPMIVLWGAWYFRGKSRISLRFFFGGCAAILLGFVLDAVLRQLIANSGGMAYGNFSYSLYGLVVGNKGWVQVGIDHPEVLAMNESQLYGYIYQLALHAFRINPTRAIGGFLGAWRDYINPDWGAFSFVNLNLFGILNVLETRWALSVISGLGLLGCIRRVRDPRGSLVLASMVGILASVPFAPPIDSDLMRAYAATIPFVAIWVALGLYTIFKGLKWLGEEQTPVDEGPALSLVIPGVVFALFCFLSPLLEKGLSQPTQFTKAECPSGQVTIYFRTDRSTAVNLISDDASSVSHLPDIRLSDFKKQQNVGGYPELANELNNLTAGQTLIQALDMGISGDSMAWLIVDTSSLPSSAGVFRVCAHPVKNKWLQNYRFYEIDTIERIQGFGK